MAKANLFEVFTPELEFRKIAVDRQLAEYFLTFHVEHETGVSGTNRKASALKIDDWAYAMVAGEWMLTHQGIAFDKEGKLFDGQHRLKALIRADDLSPGIKVWFVVATGADKETYKVIDSGMRRRLSDLLSSKGIAQAPRMSAVLKLLYSYEKVEFYNYSSWHRIRGFTPNAVEQTLAEWPEVHEAVVRGTALATAGIGNVTALSTFYCLVKRYRPDVDIDEIFDRLVSGAHTADDDPIWTLREALRRQPKMKGSSSSRVKQLGMCIKAFNKHTAGLPMLQLRYSDNEPFPRVALAEAAQ